MKLKIFYLITLTLATFLVGCSGNIVQDQDTNTITDTNINVDNQLSVKKEFIALLNTNIDSYIVDYELSSSTAGSGTELDCSVVVVNGQLVSYEEVSNLQDYRGTIRSAVTYNNGNWQTTSINLNEGTVPEDYTYQSQMIFDSNLKTEILSDVQVSNVGVISFNGTLNRKCFWYGENIETNNDLKGVCFNEEGFLVTRFQQFQLGNGVLNTVGYPLDETTKETAWNAIS